MSTGWLVTLYVVAAVLEAADVGLAMVGVLRVMNRTRARLGHSIPWDDLGQGAYDDIKAWPGCDCGP